MPEFRDPVGEYFSLARSIDRSSGLSFPEMSYRGKSGWPWLCVAPKLSGSYVARAVLLRPVNKRFLAIS